MSDPTLTRVFLSYRRDDSKEFVESLYQQLVTVRQPEEIFFDRENIIGGTDWRSILEKAVKACRVFVVLIGPQWNDILLQRLHESNLDPNAVDYVRMEIQMAQQEQRRIVPVLLNGAQFSQSMPSDIYSISAHQAHSISTYDENFAEKLAILVQNLLRYQVKIDEAMIPPELNTGDFSDLLKRIAHHYDFPRPAIMEHGTKLAGQPLVLDMPTEIAIQLEADLALDPRTLFHLDTPSKSGRSTQETRLIVADVSPVRLNVRLPGLEPFSEEHASFFAGRDEEITKLISWIRKQPLNIVMGQSSSGKTSLILAGVIPRLKSLGWACAYMNADGYTSPFELLARGLAEAGSGDIPPNYRRTPRKIAEEMAKDNVQLTRWVNMAQKTTSGSQPLVVIIDSTEELLRNLVDDTADFQQERQQFWEAILHITETEADVRVILVMDEVYAEALPKSLLQVAPGNIFLAQPPTQSRRLMLNGLQRLSRHAWESGLIDHLLGHIPQESSLPWMSYIVQLMHDHQPDTDQPFTIELFEETVRLYDEIGKLADRRFHQLPSDVQVVAKRALAELVTLDDHQRPVRRDVEVLQLLRNDDTRPAIRDFIEMFVLSHFLVRDLVKDQVVVRFSHQALLKNWQTLADMLADGDYIQQLELRAKLRQDAAFWLRRQEAQAFAPSQALLDEYQTMLSTFQPFLSDLEQKYLRAQASATPLTSYDIAQVLNDTENLSRLLEQAVVDHQTRRFIGAKLGQSDDSRDGVGLGIDNLPQFEWQRVEDGVDSFFMAKYPVTITQYNAFRQHHFYGDNSLWDAPQLGKERITSQQGNQPVTGINWYHALAFSRWLNAVMPVEASPIARNEQYRWTYSLPSYEQWHLAVTNSNQTRYPWGNDWLSSHANVQASALNDIVAVGLYPFASNHDFVTDLIGNVWEWTQTLQTTLGSRSHYLVCGGSYASLHADLTQADPPYAQSVSANHATVKQGGNQPIGFRVVLQHTKETA